MFNEINEPILIEPCDTSLYLFVCNVKDKELKGAKNNSIINIMCKNKIDDIYQILKESDEKPELGTYKNIYNIYYIFNLLYGGKCIIKTDNDEQRLNIFCKIVNNLLETNTEITALNFDYGNLIIDQSNIIYDKYVEYFKTLVDTYKIDINVYIEKKYKILSSYKEEPSINVSKLVFEYHTIDLDNIFMINE